MLLGIAILATFHLPAQAALPPPDAASPPPDFIVAAAVCGTSCLLNVAGLGVSLTSGTPLLIPLGPGLGLLGSVAGGAVAGNATAKRDVMPATVWTALCAATGYLVVGGAAAAGGYLVGASTSSDAPFIGGGFGALAAGAVGGAVGAGVGTFIALQTDPPPALE